MSETFDRERYRRERIRSLERQVTHLDAERRRLERLLALTLKIAVGGTATTPTALLEVLCAIDGAEPGRSASCPECP